ncbi:hypothetical protein TorRG33x02_001790 [Trema orientale]|uniref:Uncharacterized protein n=1 Tax=Trema orientale TaxID=63057 RepID=A0A2P5G1G7_TREOI|nr:hypothetical protein TorRG33x02_001790 [Trema orientale]
MCSTLLQTTCLVSSSHYDTIFWCWLIVDATPYLTGDWKSQLVTRKTGPPLHLSRFNESHYFSDFGFYMPSIHEDDMMMMG